MSGANELWRVTSTSAVTHRKEPHAGQTESPGGFEMLTSDEVPQISHWTENPSSVDVDKCMALQLNGHVKVPQR